MSALEVGRGSPQAQGRIYAGHGLGKIHRVIEGSLDGFGRNLPGGNVR
jgi:hypothetical protein